MVLISAYNATNDELSYEEWVEFHRGGPAKTYKSWDNRSKTSVLDDISRAMQEMRDRSPYMPNIGITSLAVMESICKKAMVAP